MTEKKMVVAVVGASINRKGRLSLGTWLRIRRAVKLGESLRLSGIPFRYVIVPVPESSDAWSRQRLQLALTQRDKGCDHVPVMPPLWERLSRKEHVGFVRSKAVQAGAHFLLM